MRAQRSERSTALARSVCDSRTYHAHATAQRTHRAARARVGHAHAAAHHPAQRTQQPTQPQQPPAPDPIPAQTRCTLCRIRTQPSHLHTRPHVRTLHATTTHSTLLHRITITNHIPHLHCTPRPFPWPWLAAACPLSLSRLRVCRRKPTATARHAPVLDQSAQPAAEQTL